MEVDAHGYGRWASKNGITRSVDGVVVVVVGVEKERSRGEVEKKSFVL